MHSKTTKPDETFDIDAAFFQRSLCRRNIGRYLWHRAFSAPGIPKIGECPLDQFKWWNDWVEAWVATAKEHEDVVWPSKVKSRDLGPSRNAT